MLMNKKSPSERPICSRFRGEIEHHTIFSEDRALNRCVANFEPGGVLERGTFYSILNIYYLSLSGLKLTPDSLHIFIEYLIIFELLFYLFNSMNNS